MSYAIAKQSVIVTSTLPSSRLLDLMEDQVGKRAVLMGSSGSGPAGGHLGAAVAMIGGLIGSGNIQVSCMLPDLIYDEAARHFIPRHLNPNI